MGGNYIKCYWFWESRRIFIIVREWYIRNSLTKYRLTGGNENEG